METQIDKGYTNGRSQEKIQNMQERSAHELYKALKSQRHDFEDHLSIMGVGELPDIFTIFDQKRDVAKNSDVVEDIVNHEVVALVEKTSHGEVKDHRDYLLDEVEDMVDLHQGVMHYLSQYVHIDEIAQKSIEKRKLTEKQAQHVLVRLKETMSQKIMSDFLSEQKQLLRAHGFDDDTVSEYVGWRLSDSHIDNPMKIFAEKDKIAINATKFCSNDAMEAYRIHLAKEKIYSVERTVEAPQKKEEEIVDETEKSMTSDQIDRLYEKMLGE